MLQQDTTNFSDRLQTSFAEVFGQTLPALLGALVILFAGYLLAKVLEKLTERGLRRIRLNHLLERGGVTQAVERSGTHVNPTRVLANLVFWLVMFTVILLAANALGLDSLANVRSEEHTSELQSRGHLVCRLLLESSGHLRALPSFPTRRSSDLRSASHSPESPSRARRRDAGGGALGHACQSDARARQPRVLVGDVHRHSPGRERARARLAGER